MKHTINIKRLRNRNGKPTYLLTVNDKVSKTVQGHTRDIIEAVRHLREKLEKLPHGANLMQLKGIL